MRSARGILGLPPFRLALSLVLIVATVTVATPNLLSLFAPSGGEVRPAAASTSALAAIEGWVTSHDGGTPVAGADVVLEGGPTITTDAAGYFAFGTDDVASLLSTEDSQAVPVTISVSAGGHSSWTLKSARYYAGDTLRVYPSLQAEGAGPRVNIAAAPRGIDTNSMQPDIIGALSVSGVAPWNADAGTMGSVVAPDAATWTPPASIRVYRTATGVVEVVPFKEYVKHVLPNEWIPTWAPASLRAGAMAVKEYGWYWVHNGGKQVALGADVKDNTEDQVYDPNVSYASTDAAVEATWPYALLRNGTLFQAQYCAGSYQADPTNDCPWGGSYYMTQWGSAYHADQGQTWEWIVQFYYNCAISGIGNGEPVPPPPAPPAPPPPTKVTTFSVGQGAVLPEVFVEAYERNGGKARLGAPTGAVRWWLPYVSEHNVLAQPFSGADSRNMTWLVFDTLKSEISGISRAYLLEGGIGMAYAQHTPPGPEWVGAPTSDPYTSVTGAMSQGFARGTLAWDGQNASFAPWPAQFSGWEARYYVGLPPESPSGPQLDLPGQPALVVDRAEPNMDWAQEAGVPKSLGVGTEAWSAQFSKQTQFEAGTYDIALSADSGVRLWVDNLLAVNAWVAGNHTEQYNLDLDGASHTIRVQYFSHTGAARLAFKMTRRE
ncbi:MAG: SpoIID/LytB domain-containing protein, partial [Chloroflexia bacterium]